MNFLVIAAIIFSFIIAVIIIIFLIPSAEKRLERKNSGKNEETKITTKSFVITTKVIVILILLIAGGLLIWNRKIIFDSISRTYFNLHPGEYPISADAQDIWVKRGQTVKVYVRPDCWSGWINLSLQAKEYGLDAPGMHEYFFWNGERILVPDKVSKWLDRLPKGSIRKIQSIRYCTFRLRGTEGEVILTLKK